MTENYKRLYRNLNDIMLTGVCSGIAEYANLDRKQVVIGMFHTLAKATG